MFAPQFEVKVSLYFRIHDSVLYGGPGSEGYAEYSMYVNPSGTAKLEDLTDPFADKIRMEMAEFCGVSPDQVEYITREVYEQETEEDDDLSCGGSQ
ncbi:hypothetical protein [Pseudoflavonifractor capillosus]|uniref:hypothetical protein n=1 Tax=Pseudoflavonifractor capillosus TaxID=106588 RepID=UPI00195667A8|nr:hypothetical protein [Pseudoflavonifractor capillosus]MBM6680068.1 hypothetical protein [Pseudoflavonifractor capillosus]